MKAFKYFILVVVSSFVFCSCEELYDEYGDEYYYYEEHVHYNSDTFYADRLLGTWQCYYPMFVGNIEFKEIKFYPGMKADIIMCQNRSTDWYTETFTYSFYGNTIRFSRQGKNISFSIIDYIFPELFVADSFGTYTWRLVKAYGC